MLIASDDGIIALVREWIEQGAPRSLHWAFVAPESKMPPNVNDQVWPRNEIDAFVLDRLEKEGLTPAREADRRTLIRRLSFDLRGLPPSIEEVEAFVSDPDPNAYTSLVETMLHVSSLSYRSADNRKAVRGDYLPDSYNLVCSAHITKLNHDAMKHHHPRLRLSIACLLVAVSTLVVCGGASKPNVILIYTDDHAQWAVGSPGTKTSTHRTWIGSQ